MRIVIDADIARASGLSEHPRSSRCRQLLFLITEKNHEFYASQQLLGEWQQHKSGFATKWLANMFARKRVNLAGIVDCSEVEDAIESALCSEKSKSSASKDSHLVAAALEADKVVASMDRAARKNFIEVSENLRSVRKLVWVDPESSQPDWIVWLENGARVSRTEWLVPQSC